MSQSSLSRQFKNTNPKWENCTYCYCWITV